MISRREREAYIERRAMQRAANRCPTPASTLHTATMGGTTTGPAPKSEPYRDRTLLDMARMRPCLFHIPGVCTNDHKTVVAAHSNWPEHGKAMGRKADDCYSAWCCAACHRWLDQGTARGDTKLAAFMLAHADQVIEWRVVAANAGEPEKFRKAARRALDRLNATEASSGL